MSALTVMFIRHAEKPGGSFPGNGTTTGGTADDKSYASGEGRLVSWPVEAEIIGVILGP